MKRKKINNQVLSKSKLNDLESSRTGGKTTKKGRKKVGVRMNQYKANLNERESICVKNKRREYNNENEAKDLHDCCVCSKPRLLIHM